MASKTKYLMRNPKRSLASKMCTNNDSGFGGSFTEDIDDEIINISKKTCQESIDSLMDQVEKFSQTPMKSEHNSYSSSTPKRHQSAVMDPWTPTANLKMLSSLASPELRRMKQLEQRSNKVEQTQDTFPNTNQDDKENVHLAESHETCDLEPSNILLGRKEKSLGLLCQRFLQMFPDYPEHDIEMSLDEVSRQLSVERRRIYDIINVLESLELVRRSGKNMYTWLGRAQLPKVLQELVSSSVVKIAAQTRKPIELKRNKSDSSLLYLKDVRKEKSLGTLCQKFLVLLLKDRVIQLEDAAKVLLGDFDSDIEGSKKLKTKVRRLYDIANILTSMGLIQKTQTVSGGTRKPAFAYIGPDIPDPVMPIISDVIVNDSTTEQEIGIKNALEVQSMDYAESLTKRQCIDLSNLGSIFVPQATPILVMSSNCNKSLVRKTMFVRHCSADAILLPETFLKTTGNVQEYS